MIIVTTAYAGSDCQRYKSQFISHNIKIKMANNIKSQMKICYFFVCQDIFFLGFFLFNIPFISILSEFLPCSFYR